MSESKLVLEHAQLGVWVRVEPHQCDGGLVTDGSAADLRMQLNSLIAQAQQILEDLPGNQDKPNLSAEQISAAMLELEEVMGTALDAEDTLESGEYGELTGSSSVLSVINAVSRGLGRVAL